MVDLEKHLIVISEDAMVFEDIETLKAQPNFSGVWDRTSVVRNVRTIYPSLTYPVHTTLRTGVYPDRHGIINNEKTNLMELSSPWEWFQDAVRCPDLFDAAKAAGLMTAAVFWPVTGRHKSIDYLVDEYWPQREDESTEVCFAFSGSSPEVIEKVIRPNEHLINGNHRKHPMADAFVHACACSIIRAFRPNLLMIHPANIDAYRHQTGLFSDKVTEGVRETDTWFGWILEACRDAGILERTNFCIISDHGQLGIVRTIAMNAVFAANGLIDVDEQGHVRDYTAMIKSTALSAQVYLKHPDCQADIEKTAGVLTRLCDEGVWGISRVFTREEVEREERLSGPFSFVIETDGYTSFSNDWKRPFVRPLDTGDYRFGHGTHGHLPDKGPQPPFIAFGPDIKPGVDLDKCRIVDEAPTFARLLGIDLPDVDGQPLEALLRVRAENERGLS